MGSAMKGLRLPASSLAVLASLCALGGCVAVPYDGYYAASYPYGYGYGYPYGYGYGYGYPYGYGYGYGYPYGYPYVSSSLYIGGGYGCCWGRGGWGRHPYYGGRPHNGGHGARAGHWYGKSRGSPQGGGWGRGRGRR